MPSIEGGNNDDMHADSTMSLKDLTEPSPVPSPHFMSSSSSVDTHECIEILGDLAKERMPSNMQDLDVLEGKDQDHPCTQMKLLTDNVCPMCICAQPHLTISEFEQHVNACLDASLDPSTPDDMHSTGAPAPEQFVLGQFLILFEIPSSSREGTTRRLLHTGDFRAHPLHYTHPSLFPSTIDAKEAGLEVDTCSVGKSNVVSTASPVRLDCIYLDTTYCNPSHTFPSQTEVISSICKLVQGVVSGQTIQSIVSRSAMTHFFSAVAQPSTTSSSNMFWKWLGGSQGGSGNSTDSTKSFHQRMPLPKNKTLIVVGAYMIGKEKVVIGIAQAISSSIYADTVKRRILSCLEDPDLSSRLVARPEDANVHICSMNKLNKESLEEMLVKYQSRFTDIIAVRPTGWIFNKKTTPSTSFSVTCIKPRYITKHITLVPIPYSEHSSFLELEKFIRVMNVDKVIPTVGMENTNSRHKINHCINMWLKSGKDDTGGTIE
ncbi:hypothetical protein BASA81_009920 [Batrachochytrium salamandrivorans]|nr:hypothetical protein BASA81_009920 [Batrachochytrium salamandrivorans]